jgi:ABC-2 type transport system ATP-binding protein
MPDGAARGPAVGAGKTVISVSGLTRRFRGTLALDGVSLEIREGELFGVVGGDGAGKTTLLQSICAILDPTAGHVTVEQRDSVRDAAAITSRIGYVAQAYSLYEDLTVEENLQFFGAIRGVEPGALATRRAELLRFAGLEPFLARRAHDLSGGMQKKLAVCCSLLHDPRVLVLDEPTLGVDPVSRRELWRMLTRYQAAGNTIVLATSYMDEAARCDRVALLNAGRVIACERPDDLGADLEEAVIALLEPHDATAEPVEAHTPRHAMSQSSGESVRIDNLTKRFGDFVAVDHVSFSLRRGEIFGLLGPNGSGKSATIKMLCGIYPPSSGTIVVAGMDVVTRPGAAKERIGYMSQRFSLYPDLTVDENIEFFGEIYGLSSGRLRSRRNAVMAQAGLERIARNLVRSLSGALRQHVALSCALLHEPDILFLDEPTSGVDPAARRGFWRLIAALAEGGTTVLVTTHYLREAEACDRVAFIDKGRIIALDTPAAIRRHHRTSTLEDAFLLALEEPR